MPTQRTQTLNMTAQQNPALPIRQYAPESGKYHVHHGNDSVPHSSTQMGVPPQAFYNHVQGDGMCHFEPIDNPIPGSSIQKGAPSQPMPQNPANPPPPHLSNKQFRPIQPAPAGPVQPPPKDSATLVPKNRNGKRSGDGFIHYQHK